MKPAPTRIAGWIRNAWDMIGLTLVLIICVELASTVILRHFRPASTGPDPRVFTEVYDGAPWAPQLFREWDLLTTRWSPYTYWHTAKFDGECIHVDERGLRRTVLPRPPESYKDKPRVFVFGGSTAWGFGARDAHTIPSGLGRELERRGVPAEVVNYGEIGYVSTQEVIALMIELRRGNIPDAVVFYDGINDVSAAFQSHVAGIPHNEQRRRAEFNLLSRKRGWDYERTFLNRWLSRSSTLRLSRALIRRVGGGGPAAAGPRRQDTAAGDSTLARDVADVYRSNIEVVRMLASRYGFSVLFFWQPVIFTSAVQTPYERRQLEAAQPYRGFFERSYAAVCSRCADVPGFHDISSLLCDRHEPSFVDFMHIDEGANRRVADRIAVDLEPLLIPLEPTAGR